MSVNPEDAYFEEYMDELYKEHKKYAIEEFTSERLTAYFLGNRLLAEPAMRALSTSRTMVAIDLTAGFIFSAIAIEVGLKSGLLKPIVYGLVHTESVAELITNLAISRQSMYQFRGLLFEFLQEQGGVKLDNYIRQGSRQKLWDEIDNVIKARNRILHKADSASINEAEMALGVATEILEKIFPSVVNKLGLHLHDGVRICDDLRCQ